MKEALKLSLEALEILKQTFFKKACLLPEGEEDDDRYLRGYEEDEEEWAIPALKAIATAKAALAKQDGQSNFCAQCEAFARELKAVKQEQVKPAPKGFLGEADMVEKFVGDVKANFFDEVNQLTDEEILDLVRFAKAQQEPDYAYPTVEGYEEITGFKVNDTFRMGWVMARTTNDLFKQMEKNT
jgi:hypothetical protein